MLSTTFFSVILGDVTQINSYIIYLIILKREKGLSFKAARFFEYHRIKVCEMFFVKLILKANS